jgi:hypothetical protein
MKKGAMLVLAIGFAQAAVVAKVIEDTRYKFRADLPGVPSETTKEYKLEDFESRNGTLSWRTYTSGSPASQTGAVYTAAVKVFDTDTSDSRQLFEAGESDATQSIGVPLIGRSDGTFGADRLPSLTLSYQGGVAGGGVLKCKVLLVVKEKRLYEVTFYYAGTDQTAVGERFFRSFEILK